MRLRNNCIRLGNFRLSSARAAGNQIVFLLAQEGRIEQKTLDMETKALRVKDRTFCFAEDCWLVPGGRLERRGELLYVPDA